MEANGSQRRKQREVGWRHQQGQILQAVVGHDKVRISFLCIGSSD